MEQDGGGPIPSASLGPGAVPADELPALWRQSISPFFDAPGRAQNAIIVAGMPTEKSVTSEP